MIDDVYVPVDRDNAVQTISWLLFSHLRSTDQKCQLMLISTYLPQCSGKIDKSKLSNTTAIKSPTSDWLCYTGKTTDTQGSTDGCQQQSSRWHLMPVITPNSREVFTCGATTTQNWWSRPVGGADVKSAHTQGETWLSQWPEHCSLLLSPFCSISLMTGKLWAR